MANTIDNTVREVMRTYVYPRIEQQVAEQIEGAALRAIAHLEPDLIEREVRKAVRNIIANRIRVEVTVTDG